MLEGHVLDERYRIERTIGGGGMANVYLAYDLILGREVAVKVLRLEHTNDSEFIARFEREVQSATSLSHPNIVNIYDVGEEKHILYMVMEYVNGMTLKEYIAEHHPIEIETVLNIMKKVLSAIAMAHANGLIHRDIKPQNILLDKDGEVKVTDFGIAIALSATSLTQTNSIMGSVHYLSPEQARGETATKKSDIYALGILLFEMLTSTLPFDGQSAVSIALKHLQHDTPSIHELNPNVPQSVENVVLKATAKNPKHRYQSIYEMEQAIEDALDPNNIEDAKFQPPSEIDEKTKAIPIIHDQLKETTKLDDTIVHNLNPVQMDPEETEKIVSAKPIKEKSKKKKKKKKKKKLWFFLFVLPLLLILVTLAIFVIPLLLKDKETTVPNLINKEYEDAVDVLEANDLKTERAFVYSDDVEQGFVVKTSPKSGKKVKEETLITVYVSQGKEKVTIDNYTDESYEATKKILEDLGYYNIMQYEKFSDLPKGQILNQIQPIPGTEVVPSESSVIFEVSAGPELKSLNNLKGMSEGEVDTYFAKHNFVKNIHKESSDTVPKGEVIRQSPEAETALSSGATVNVYISTGAKDEKPVEVEKTFTVPYEPEQVDDDSDNTQLVEIYIKDSKHDLEDVYKDSEIKKDKTFTIKLKLNPDEEGHYKVVRDGEVLIDESVKK